MPLIGLEEMLLEWGRQTHDGAVDNLINDLHERCPIGQTHDLVDSFHGPETQENGLTFISTVGFDADYASYTDEGAAPHVIEPSNARALRFEWENGPDGPGVYYFHHVNHPGQPGSHWFSETVDSWTEYLQNEVHSA